MFIISINLSAILIPCCPCIFLKSYGTKDLKNNCRCFSSVCLLTKNKKHDLHSPPRPIDWREHTIGAVHDRNLPTRSLQVPENYENFLWHRVKVRSIVTGLRRDDERYDDRSHRRVSIMSSLDVGWFRLITNILIQSRDLAWLRGGTSVAPWRHKCSHVPVFRRLFDRLPVRISTSDLHHRILRKKLYHIRAYDFGVQFSFNPCGKL